MIDRFTTWLHEEILLDQRDTSMDTKLYAYDIFAFRERVEELAGAVFIGQSSFEPWIRSYKGELENSRAIIQGCAMLHQWLRDRCVPVVVTLVTEDADRACRKNSVNFEQLVSAFARLDGLKLPFRSASHQYTLDSFALRFVRGSDMRPSSAMESDPALAEVAISAAENAAAAAAAATAESEDRDGHGREAAGTLLESGVEEQSWYKRYRTRLWESLCHQEHEMLDCPAAVLVVVSSTEASGDPVACFDELSTPRYLPPPYQSRQYDPHSPALVYVLLHDWCRGAALGVDPDRVLSQMRGTFTAGQCRLLCINSLPPESPNLSQPDLWMEVAQQPTSGAIVEPDDDAPIKTRVRGAFLSPEDILATREFVRGLTSQVVVPSMERRIQTLNQNVSSLRKGVKNVLKSWWRKPREGVDPMAGDGGGAGGATYRFDRIESQIRLLADSAFLMRDYETAASMYRMARDDFKSDRTILHYAAASEMLAISLYLLQGRASASAVTSPDGSSVGYGQLNGIVGVAGSSGGVGGVGTPTAKLVVAAAASVGQDLTFSGLSTSKSTTISGGGGNLSAGAPPSAPSSGGLSGLNPAALLGRGREADAAFSAALDAYQRRAAEDSVTAAAAAGRVGGYAGTVGAERAGAVGISGVAGLVPPAARLAARAAFLYADVAAAPSEDRFAGGLTARTSGDIRGGTELQAEVEEALLHASVQETPLSAAILLEVSANRCRAAGRLRRASFRLVQAGHMYKEFAQSRAAEWRKAENEKQQQRSGEKSISVPPEQHFLGIHAARCFLAALSGYQASGWLAAEEYTCTVLPAELRALHRPVAALQLYVRLLSARGQGQRTEGDGGSADHGKGSGAGSPWTQQSHQGQQQQQNQHKRAAREKALMLAFRELCRSYPDAACVAARAWARGRGSSRLDMTFFPSTSRTPTIAHTPPPTPTPSSTATTVDDAESARPATGDLLDLAFNAQGGRDGPRSGTASEQGRGDAEDEGVVFEGLSLPAVVHEETKTVDTENASVQPSVESTDTGSWASDMADALRAELAAADAVTGGKGPWLTVSAAYGYQAGTFPRDLSTNSSNTRRPLHVPPTPRSAPVGEPITVLVVLENRFSVAVSVEDLQLVLTAPAEAGGASGVEEGLNEDVVVETVEVNDEDFAAICACPDSSRGGGSTVSSAVPGNVSSKPTAVVAVERKRATIGSGERLPILLKFCVLRALNEMLTVSSVRWTVLDTSVSSSNPQGKGGVVGTSGMGSKGSRVWVCHRLEGKGQLLHGTREQRAARARAPAPPPRFEATGPMPWLGCSLEGVPPTILQGEAVRATLKISNRGRAAAGDLCLKTNLPWVAFENPQLNSKAKTEETAAPAGGAIGASGTTLLPPVGVIMSGESVELPVWVRGRGGGRQTVKMVVRYKRARFSRGELEGGAVEEGLGDIEREGHSSSSEIEGEGPANPLFRMERHVPVSVEMCVLPSLSVAASVLPSYSRRGEYVLSLEATNYRTSGDEARGNRHLRIHKVCAISRCWHMEPLAGFPSYRSDSGNDKEGEGAGGTVVRWQERITFHYRLFPAESPGMNGSGDGDEDDDAMPIRHNDCALGVPNIGMREGSADSPHLPLLCLEQAASNYYVACRKHRQQKLMEAAEAAAEEIPKTIQGVRKDRECERAAAALKKEEEDEERRWRTQRHAHPTSPEALCPPDLSLVHLMVLWGLDEDEEAPARRGQHHVRSLVIRPERVDRQCPLVLTVKYPSKVRWDDRSLSFAEDSAGCDAEVTVCATNRLAGPGEDAKVNFTFEVRPDDGPRRLSTVPGAQPQSTTGGGQVSSAKRAPRNRFVWLGPTRRRVVGLGPGEATTIPLKVRFFRPGVFDLNRFRFVVEFAPPSSAPVQSTSSVPMAGRGHSTQPSSPLPSTPQQTTQGAPTPAPAPAPSSSQQRTTSLAQQQGRVTFVFPAQYLVTVAPASHLGELANHGGAKDTSDGSVSGVVPMVGGKGWPGVDGPIPAAIEQVSLA